MVPISSPRHPSQTSQRCRLRVVAVFVILSGSAILTGLASAAPAAATTTTACSTGVAVVVDFTDIGGKLDVSCAKGGPATGRDALVAAGFTATDSPSGLICALNSMPNPCPATFTGVYWSYWHATPGGAWVSYQVGADVSHPQAGQIEGWRYDDGTKPPGIAPSAVAAALPIPATSTTPTATPTSSPAAQTGTAPMIVALGILALLAFLLIWLVLRARRRSGPGDD